MSDWLVYVLMSHMQVLPETENAMPGQPSCPQQNSESSSLFWNKMVLRASFHCWPVFFHPPRRASHVSPQPYRLFSSELALTAQFVASCKLVYTQVAGYRLSYCTLLLQIGCSWQWGFFICSFNFETHATTCTWLHCSNSLLWLQTSYQAFPLQTLMCILCPPWAVGRQWHVCRRLWHSKSSSTSSSVTTQLLPMPPRASCSTYMKQTLSMSIKKQMHAGRCRMDTPLHHLSYSP